MFGRILVFALGVGVGVIVVVKAKDYLRHKVPAAVTEKINSSASGLMQRVADFTADARAAMAERETELREALGLVDDDAIPDPKHAA